MTSSYVEYRSGMRLQNTSHTSPSRVSYGMLFAFGGNNRVVRSTIIHLGELSRPDTLPLYKLAEIYKSRAIAKFGSDIHNTAAAQSNSRTAKISEYFTAFLLRCAASIVNKVYKHLSINNWVSFSKQITCMIAETKINSSHSKQEPHHMLNTTSGPKSTTPQMKSGLSSQLN